MIPGEKVMLVSLADSLQSLKEHFNRGQDGLRFLALLSPT